MKTIFYRALVDVVCTRKVTQYASKKDLTVDPQRSRLCTMLRNTLLLCLAVASTSTMAFDGNGDGFDDIAFYNTSSGWGSVPVLFSDGRGGWADTNRSAPAWANAAGSQAVRGDFDGDGTTDLAFHNPGSSWSTVPVLFSPRVQRGRLSRFVVSRPTPSITTPYTPTNRLAARWAHAAGAIAIPGDFNRDGKTDIAFHNPGSTWRTVPVLQSRGDGTWAMYNRVVPSWANAENVIAVAGDFNNDRYDDIAFYSPGSSWTTVPILFGYGDGYWQDANKSVPSWANMAGVIAKAGDFDGDDATDLAFYWPGSPWMTVPLLLSNPDGTWRSKTAAVPAWANAPGAVAIVGDYDGSGTDDIAFHGRGEGWAYLPVLFSEGDGTWTAHQGAANSVVNDGGVSAVSGDFNKDGLLDLAFHRNDSAWNSVPVLLSDGLGDWKWANDYTPTWTNTAGARALGSQQRGFQRNFQKVLLRSLQQRSSTNEELFPCGGNTEPREGLIGARRRDFSLPAPTITRSAAADNAFGFEWDLDWPGVRYFEAFVSNTTDPEYCHPCRNPDWKDTHSYPNVTTGSAVPTLKRSASHVAEGDQRHMLIESCHGTVRVGTSYRVVLHAVSSSGLGPASLPLDITLTRPAVFKLDQRGFPVQLRVDKLELLWDRDSNQRVDQSPESDSFLYPAEPDRRDMTRLNKGNKFMSNRQGPAELILNTGTWSRFGGGLQTFQALHLHLLGSLQPIIHEATAGSFGDNKGYRGVPVSEFGPPSRGLSIGLFDNSGYYDLRRTYPLGPDGMQVLSGRITWTVYHYGDDGLEALLLEWNFNAAIIAH